MTTLTITELLERVELTIGQADELMRLSYYTSARTSCEIAYHELNYIARCVIPIWKITPDEFEHGKRLYDRVEAMLVTARGKGG